MLQVSRYFILFYLDRILSALLLLCCKEREKDPQPASQYNNLYSTFYILFSINFMNCLHVKFEHVDQEVNIIPEICINRSLSHFSCLFLTGIGQ